MMPEMNAETKAEYEKHRDDSRVDLEGAILRSKIGGYQYWACTRLLSEMDEQERQKRSALDETRHGEMIAEARTSRLLGGWALVVAVFSLLVGGAGLWRSLPKSEPEFVSPAPPSITQTDLSAPTVGTEPTPVAPAAEPPTLPICPPKATETNEPPIHPTENKPAN